MPYISSSNGRREKLQLGDIALTAGELNYQIFEYLKHSNVLQVYKETVVRMFVNNFLGEKPNYQKYNDMTGCLIRCKKELERRLNINADFLIDVMESYDEEINLYEDKKIIENGDVE